jgi:hypothetical protein
MHYHIIGTDHKYQTIQGKTKGLRDLMEEYMKRHSVVLIAEEVNANKDVLTFGRELMDDDRKWLSIDMTDEERKEASIQPCDPFAKANGPDGYFMVDPYSYGDEAKRESFWIQRIEKWCSENEVTDGTVLITCGYNHLPFLAGKVIRRKHAVSLDHYFPIGYDKEAFHGVFVVYE